MIKVKYIGNKKSQWMRFQCGEFTWKALGAILELPDECEKDINRHPLIFEIVGRNDKVVPIVESEPQAELTAPLVDLSIMDKDGLIAYCQRELGIEPDRRWGNDRLRQTIQSHMAGRAYGARFE